MLRNIKICGIDVGTCCAEVGVERQRLVKFICDMQINILGDAPVVGVEVLVVPLVTAVVTARTVCPTIIAAHGNDILAFFDIRCQVKSECHHTILAETNVMSVQIDVSALTHTLELDEVFRVSQL